MIKLYFALQDANLHYEMSWPCDVMQKDKNKPEAHSLASYIYNGYPKQSSA